MQRREFIMSAASMGLVSLADVVLPKMAWADEKSRMKITDVRLIKVKPRYQAPAEAKGIKTFTGETARPMSIYPEYKGSMSWSPTGINSAYVEITTDKGIKGIGIAGAGGGDVITRHLTKLVLGRDPFDIEKNWDHCWRASLGYSGNAGIATAALGGIDLALWDIVGKALKQPVYNLLGGRVKERIPCYSTSGIESIERLRGYGFTRQKIAVEHGPASGREGMEINLASVERMRKVVGPHGEVMLDCWMAWGEDYTYEMCKLLEAQRVYWVEEVLAPYDYEGFGRLASRITSTRIATGEHEYTRYGFRRLLQTRGAQIWQPDMTWCGGLTELRRIGALAAAYDIPVIPHGGGINGATHWMMANVNSQWAEMFDPKPGFEEQFLITKDATGGLYTQAPDEPGFGWDFLFDGYV